ncbi:MAG: hypothetical protein EHM58_12540 [Ignavibacteriae bacterium]|nr:MAG: hypothetical protein EHM58_12540 [Ignavibacteriota bacterium]
MNKSVLIELLSKFTPKEMKEFAEFVYSPFFNKNHSIIKLFDYLRKQYPDFENNAIEKKYIYSEIFPDVEYNDGFMRTLMSGLCSLAENYLSYICFKYNNYYDKKFLLYELNNRGLDRLFERNYKAVSKQLEDEQIKDADFFYDKYDIGFENIYHLHRVNMDKIEKIIPQSDVEDVFDNLTYFYLIQSMDHYLYFLNIMEMYKFRFNTEKFEKTLKILEADKFKNVPAVELYYNLLMLFLNEDDISYFYDTLKFLKNNVNDLNKDYIHKAYLNLKNYCRRKIQKEENSFIKELFDIYKIELDLKIYSLQNEMSFWYYTGVIETALKLKEYDWTKEFIEKYKCELAENSRENTYLYALSLYEFALKNFEKALEILSKVRYNDVYHKLKYRSLLLMIYYELDYWDLLIAQIDSFNHFLLNDVLVQSERKEYYSNFLKYIKTLNTYKESEKKQGPEILSNKIKENPVVYNKEWLLEKLNELAE